MVSINDISNVRAASTYSKDGDKVGKVGDVYVDDLTNEPAWVTITAGLFGTKTLFAPLAGARLEGDRLILAYSKDVIANAPAIADSGHISDTEQQALIDYFTVHVPFAEGSETPAERVAEPAVTEPAASEAVVPGAAEAAAVGESATPVEEEHLASLDAGLYDASTQLAGAQPDATIESPSVEPSSTDAVPPSVWDAPAGPVVESTAGYAAAGPAAAAGAAGAVAGAEAATWEPNATVLEPSGEVPDASTAAVAVESGPDAVPMTSPYGGRSEEAREADVVESGEGAVPAASTPVTPVEAAGSPLASVAAEPTSDEPSVVDATAIGSAAAGVAAAGVAAAAAGGAGSSDAGAEPDMEPVPAVASEPRPDAPTVIDATGIAAAGVAASGPQEATEAEPAAEASEDEGRLADPLVPVSGVNSAPAEGDTAAQTEFSGQFRMYPTHTRETIYRDADGNILYSIVQTFEEIFGGSTD